MIQCSGDQQDAVGDGGADLDWTQTRRLMAKVLAIAVKEATGMVKVSGAAKVRAQRFLLTDWAWVWADELEAAHHLDTVRQQIVAGDYERNGNGRS